MSFRTNMSKNVIPDKISGIRLTDWNRTKRFTPAG